MYGTIRFFLSKSKTVDDEEVYVSKTVPLIQTVVLKKAFIDFVEVHHNLFTKLRLGAKAKSGLIIRFRCI